MPSATGKMRPTPRPDSVSRAYWAAANGGELVIQRCVGCATSFYPPVPFCRSCTSTDLEWKRASGRGKVHSYTVIHQETVAGVSAPYVVVEVELDDPPGVVMTTSLVGGGDAAPTIGAAVRVVFETLPNKQALPQFTLTEAPE